MQRSFSHFNNLFSSFHRIAIYSFISLLAYSFISLFPSPVFAQAAPAPATPPATTEQPAWFANTMQSFSDTLFEAGQTQSIQKEGFDTATQINMQAALGCQLTGCSSNPEHVFYYEKSSIAHVNNYIAMMYRHPPADFGYWLADTGRTLGFLPRQAYAQGPGIGFSGLAPLLPIWKAFRNIAYLLLAIVMIVIGFMVMMRKKIDPKTVVTVQNAIPKIVVTLLLITFSYAIVGLLVDLMYLVLLLIISILVPASGGTLGPDTATKYLGGGIWTVLGGFIGVGFSVFDDMVRLITPFHGQGLAGGVLQATNSAFLSVILFVILGVALLFGYIRILFMLLSAYIQIIIGLIIGPLQLMFEAMPGGASFSSWIKNMVGHLSVFPVTAGMLLIGTMLTRLETAFPSIQGGRLLWTPPLLSGGEGTSGIAGLIGLGFVMTIPTVAGAIREALKAKPPISAGPGAIFGPIGAGVGQFMQLGYQASFMASPFLHKTTPSTPTERQMAAAAGKTGGHK